VKIVRLSATPVEVPRSSYFLPKTAHGESAASRYVILEIETDTGLIGVGEVTCSPRWNGEEALGTTAVVNRYVAPAVVDADPLSWADVARRLDAVVRDRPFLRAAVEMACLDLAGHHLDVPAHSLLGGSYRTEINTKFVLPARQVDTVRRMAEQLKARGPSTVKVKVGLDVEADVGRVSAVREVFGPEVDITVDANEGWRPGEAISACRRLEDLGVVAVEQPLPREAWMASAALRNQTSMAVMGDESIWTYRDVFEAARTGAFDTVSVYPGKCGGVRAAVRIAEAARALGLAVAYGSNLELGVGAAAMAHAIAATRELSPIIPADLIGPLYFESTLVRDASFVGWAGAKVPTGSGLGVELDRSALAEYRLVV